jgi:Ricin-type beta-trefoil lectin domain
MSTNGWEKAGALLSGASVLMAIIAFATPEVRCKFGLNSESCPSGDPFRIVASNNGKCIDVDGNPGRDMGKKLQLWNCESSEKDFNNNSPTDQIWTITNDGHIRNKLSWKCIDVDGGPGHTDGAKLQLWDCEFSGEDHDNNSPTDQIWTITNDGHIRNKFSEKCINVDGGPGHTDGAKLQLGDCESSETWRIEHEGS